MSGLKGRFATSLFVGSNPTEVSILNKKSLKARELYYKNPNICKCCGEIIELPEGVKPSIIKVKKFCNSSCSAKYNNSKRIKKFKKCLKCGDKIKNDKRFCNFDCYKKYNYETYISEWKKGKVNGMKGKESVSNHIRRYLFKKYKNKCCKCGWNKVNPKTGRIPLTVNHIDGDHENNKENNLELICPNCHSLTSNYGSLNMGKGRKIRRKNKKI